MSSFDWIGSFKKVKTVIDDARLAMWEEIIWDKVEALFGHTICIFKLYFFAHNNKNPIVVKTIKIAPVYLYNLTKWTKVHNISIIHYHKTILKDTYCLIIEL